MKLHRIFAGEYWTDSGAMMGVLPWSIWGEEMTTDERRRQKLNLNLLLIASGDRLILTDSGIGNRLSEKQMQIYHPSPFNIPAALAELGYQTSDITDVILTHLHFDHAGGLVSEIDGKDVLTFPNAAHWVQKVEWEMAKEPDGLNRAAYSFQHQLALVEAEADLRIIDGTHQITDEVSVEKLGGHSVGHQIVIIDSAIGYYIYAGDIIPTVFHSSPAVTSAYDVNRKESYHAKRYIRDLLAARKGYLFLDHDLKKWQIPYGWEEE